MTANRGIQNTLPAVPGVTPTDKRENVDAVIEPLICSPKMAPPRDCAAFLMNRDAVTVSVHCCKYRAAPLGPVLLVNVELVMINSAADPLQVMAPVPPFEENVDVMTVREPNTLTAPAVQF